MPSIRELRSSIRPVATAAHRKLLSFLARDITDATATRSAIVFAPHPDDETIGCGATIARKTAARARVKVIVVADGGSSTRRAECVEACRRLGVPEDDVAFLGAPDRVAEEDVESLVAGIRSAWDEPVDEIYSPCAIDAHADHRAVARAVELVRRSDHADVPRLEYPVWFWNRWAWAPRAPATASDWLGLVVRPIAFTVRTPVRSVSTDGFLAVKRQALAAHVSQVEGTDDPAGDPLDPKWLQLFLGRDEVFFASGRRS